ncbi:fumarylacetoacetate hydrolase family protein [Microbacterium halophytorum]|uniref:fumarylacetoacetate hydrolase family protein n=1 Tax=Microbacterium halophytorum TaxID=2067568 RepID=UPI000CFD7C1D|nr:fumarylacetoacetate hydrolase family protein [Microbacterium halophytorum]
MRIGRWTRSGADEDGFIEDAGVIPFPDGLTVTDVVAGGTAALAGLRARAGEPVAALADVALRSPIAPASVRDFVAFEEHVEGVSAGVEGKSHVADEWYEFPTFYFTNPHTITGPGEITPPVTRKLDFELEVAVVVGAHGTNLSPEDGERAIFGYTIMNDWSARDLQAREMQVRLGPSKGKDFATSLGPWIVTADELEPFRDADGFLALRAEVCVNGELVGEDLVSNAGWPFGEFVAYASRAAKVVPGDVLGSGTVGNGGCLGELWGRGSDRPPLKTGDEVRMVVEGIGELVGTVGAAVEPPAIPPARKRSRARRRSD